MIRQAVTHIRESQRFESMYILQENLIHMTCMLFCASPCMPLDEDINPDKGMATPTKPAQAPPGPLTRARARELNFIMILKNERPEAS
jgi:hypothetical protein